MIKEHDISELVPLNKIVKQAIMDTYGDYGKDEARFTAWAVRALKKLTKEALKSGKRQAVLNVNKNLNNAVLPCDFKEELFVGIINDCGEKIALNINGDIVNSKLNDDVPCENECDKGCDCYPKQLCADLETTQVINKIRIGDTDYDETVTSTLQPNGEYYVVTTTPYLNTVTSGIDYVTRKEYITTFDVADCGCIEKTERNDCRIENLCPDAYCCYCTGCNTGTTDFGGYRIFKENNTIQFDRSMPYDKVYMEYRGFLPKSGNEYLVPEVAFECLINLVKFKSVENKKGVSMSDRQWHWERYLVERGNMTKTLGRMSLHDIIHSALTVPTFDYNKKYCVTSTTSAYSPSANATVVTNTIYVPTPSGGIPSSGCNPAIITTNGGEMEGGTKYHNAILIGVPFRVFAGAFNRMLFASEYNVLPTGGFEILTGVYTSVDEFDIYPKWCDANVVDIPQPVVVASIYPFVITSADFEADGVTYLNADMDTSGIFLQANNTPNPFLFAPNDFIYVVGGIQITVPGFDANTFDYTIVVNKLK